MPPRTEEVSLQNASQELDLQLNKLLNRKQLSKKKKKYLLQGIAMNFTFDLSAMSY
jgi:hypothetical protein